MCPVPLMMRVFFSRDHIFHDVSSDPDTRMCFRGCSAKLLLRGRCVAQHTQVRKVMQALESGWEKEERRGDTRQVRKSETREVGRVGGNWVDNSPFERF